MNTASGKDQLDGGDLQACGDAFFALSSFVAKDISVHDSLAEMENGELEDNDTSPALTPTMDKLSLKKTSSMPADELRSLHAQSLMQLSCHFDTDAGDKRPDGFLEEEFKDEFPSLTFRKQHLQKDPKEETNTIEKLLGEDYIEKLNEYHFGG